MGPSATEAPCSLGSGPALEIGCSGPLSSSTRTTPMPEVTPHSRQVETSDVPVDPTLEVVTDHDCFECGHHRLIHDKPGGLCGEVINDVWGDSIPCDCIEFEEPA